MVSCNTITSSIMFLSGKNAVWDGLMTFWAIWEILFVATLINILKLTLKRHIGLYCCILVTFLHFGSKIIVPKFKLYNGNSPL
jgi:hypothetical protein